MGCRIASVPSIQAVAAPKKKTGRHRRKQSPFSQPSTDVWPILDCGLCHRYSTAKVRRVCTRLLSSCPVRQRHCFSNAAIATGACGGSHDQRAVALPRAPSILSSYLRLLVDAFCVRCLTIFITTSHHEIPLDSPRFLPCWDKVLLSSQPCHQGL